MNIFIVLLFYLLLSLTFTILFKEKILKEDKILIGSEKSIIIKNIIVSLSEKLLLLSRGIYEK